LMIGDTTHDLAMARNAGVASVAVSFGAHAHDLFDEFSPLYIASTPSELAVWLATQA
jgi:phosphoglycolate phosphatase